MPTESEILQAYRDYEQAAAKEHQAMTGKLVEAGYERYGQAHFDSLASDLADHVGAQNVPALTQLMSGLDAPECVAEYLATHADEAKAIAKMPAPRALVALGRIESRVAPNVAANGALPNARPGWLNAPSGRRSNDDILADDGVDDRRWEKAFKAKYKDGFFPGMRR
jgi:hypothetical protein